MQKLILGREMALSPRIILANQPTRGLDIGAVGYVHQQLLKARASGAGILLISEDLDELLALSDRVAVMYRGRCRRRWRARDVTIRHLGLMMAGHGFAGAGRCGLNRAPRRARSVWAIAPLVAVVASFVFAALLALLGGASPFAVFAAVIKGAAGHAICVPGDADPRHAADLHRPRRRRRVPRQAVEHRRRGAALYRRGHDGRARHRAAAAAGADADPDAHGRRRMLAGALLLLGPTFLKTRFGVDEVVTTLLLNFIDRAVRQHAARRRRSRTRWASAGRNPRRSSPRPQLPKLIQGKRLHLGFVIAIGAALRRVVHQCPHHLRLRDARRRPQSARGALRRHAGQLR